MRDRSFADFVIGALACVSVLGFYAFVREGQESEAEAAERRRRAEVRWSLPRRRRRRRSLEDACRHCAGVGACERCAPSPCRVCRGTGAQPRDETLIPRLAAIWDGVT